MSFSAWFQCISGCDGRWPLDEVRYRCPRCNDLLEVVHDRDALLSRPPAAWRALFDERWRATRHPDTSGVWGKRELVAPHVREEHIVTAAEGASALLPVPGLAAELGIEEVRVKQCGVSHTGSFKDLGMTVLVSTVKQMIADGRRIAAIACASTGDTSAALAAYGAAAGVRTVVILPRGKISTAQLVQPLANGALVLALDTDFDGCMAIVQELAEREGVYLANSMNSLRLEGQKTVAMEIVQQLGWEIPDWVVIPGGNLGNVSALGAGFQTLVDLGLITRSPRICVAQAANASPLHQAFLRGFENFESVPARTTLASAIQIGNPVSWKKAVRAKPPSDDCTSYDVDRYAGLIATGLAQFQKWGAPQPVALRTGNLQVAEATYQAMAAVGLELASNVGLAIYRPKEAALRLASGRHRFHGVTELPVLTYDQLA
ncbi:MAG: threonine synthase, partial [Kofleriaceae bacterium]